MRYERVQKTNTFNSWKETASYLGRGVRTVQRWEAELQLPVHRLGRSERSPIFAFKAELDGWLRKQAGRWSQPAESPGDPGATRPYSKALKHSGQICTTNSKALQLIQKQQAHTRTLAEQVQRMACLLPAVKKTKTNRSVLYRSSKRPSPSPKDGQNVVHPKSPAATSPQTAKRSM